MKYYGRQRPIRTISYFSSMKKKAFAQIAFEFLSIVFAVLLALGLNTFKQSLDLQNEAALLKNKIILECKHNQLELDTVINLNSDFKKYLDSLNQLDEVVEDFNISIASELLTKSAWNFTLASKSFSHLDEDFLNDAATVYEMQEYYMLISNQMFQNFGQMILSDPEVEQSISISDYYLSNLNATASSLKNAYTQFLTKYE